MTGYGTSGKEILTSVAAGAAGRASGFTRATRGVAALLSSLVRVDLTLGELAGTDTLVRGSVLLEASVLYDLCQLQTAKRRGSSGVHTSGLVGSRHVDGLNKVKTLF